jgi:soluble lytic murein transglycosylase-like protein
MALKRLFSRIVIALLIVLPWSLLLLQSYADYKFPIKTDRYGHPYRQTLSLRIQAQTYLWRSPFKTSNAQLPVEAIQEMIQSKAAMYKVDPCLVESIVAFESVFQPNTITTTGGMGLMALEPATARNLQVSDPFNPEENIDGGTRLLRRLSDNLNGKADLVLAGYNAGQNAVQRHNGVPPFRETMDYVRHVGRLYTLCKLGRMADSQPENGAGSEAPK